MVNKTKTFLSTQELAKKLGISRVAVWKRIKKGQIKAIQAGRNFIIDEENLTLKSKKEIEKAVKKTVAEYGETLRLLGEE